MLQGGAVMDRLLQPHESHTNYVLQFMMDYNLQGMNTVREGCIKFMKKPKQALEPYSSIPDDSMSH